mmetsp:Transcript_107243/g.341601  ORF Transcript_107243/g.341601 Transcript_107243/m.341601 type:complete len:267 (+) Transcript_107243:354-1154(+)
MAPQHMVGQHTQLVGLLLHVKVLEVAKADEGRGNAADHCSLLHTSALTVLPHDVVASADQGQGPRSRHPKSVHGLRGQELTDGRAEHGSTVRLAAVRREPGALELHLPALPRGSHGLPQRDRPAVAELAGEAPPLVAGVHRRMRVEARENAVACEDLQKQGTLTLCEAQTQKLRGNIVRVCHQTWAAYLCWPHAGIRRIGHFAGKVLLCEVRGQVARERVVACRSKLLECDAPGSQLRGRAPAPARPAPQPAHSGAAPQGGAHRQG